MLNFCPKCRSFYRDAELRFCLKDGVPLIGVGENENLRREGENFIQLSEQKIKREIFRKQIRTIVSILITTILTILIISALTINSWLYLNPEKVETAKNEPIQPEAQPSIELSVEPEPTAEIPAETVPANDEPSPEIPETPTPELSPTTDRFPSPTPIPTIEITKKQTPETTSMPNPTPTMTPTPVPTPIPTETPVLITVSQTQICTQEEKSRAESFIKNRYSETWRKNILNQKEPLQSEIASANDISFDQISVKLNFSPENISVSISPDCQKAAVRIYVLWTVQANSPNVKIRKVPPRRNSVLPYRCEKSGSTWNCK